MKIAVVGSYGVGMTMRVGRAPRGGETVAGGVFSQGPGGKGSNQAIGAARLGAEVALLTAVGDDALGVEARRLWSDEGVEVPNLLVSGSATMVGFITVEDGGENRIAIAPGALNDLASDDVERFRPVIADADMLLVSMEIPLPVVEAALRVAREVGTRTLLNPAPANPMSAAAWSHVDYVTPNRTEAAVLADLDAEAEVDRLLDALRRKTNAVIVLTLGADGTAVDTGSGRFHVEAIPPRAVVDTTGAGDSFNASLAVALVEGRELRDALNFAAAAGAHAVSIEGVIDALPTSDDISRLIGIKA